MISPAIVHLESIISRLPKDLAHELIDWRNKHIETLSTEVHTTRLQHLESDLRGAVYRVKSAAVNMSEEVLKHCVSTTYQRHDRDVIVDRYTIMVIK